MCVCEVEGRGLRCGIRVCVFHSQNTRAHVTLLFCVYMISYSAFVKKEVGASWQRSPVQRFLLIHLVPVEGNSKFRKFIQRTEGNSKFRKFVQRTEGNSKFRKFVQRTEGN